MSMRFLHKDLALYLTCAGVISIACGIFGWVGFFAPELLGWPESTQLTLQILLVVLGCMPIMVAFAVRLHLRAYWVYRNITPEKMQVQIEIEEGSDSTSYFAVLLSSGSEQAQRVPVYTPGWNAKTLQGINLADVFFDPVSRKPLVIEIDGRRLWSMAL